MTAVSLWNSRVFLRSEVKVFHVDTSFLSVAALSSPDDHIYLPLYTFRPWCAPRHRQSNTKKQMKAHTNTPPPIHLSILGIQFSPLVLLRFSKWMIKSTMRFKSSGMCGYCQRLVRQPGGSRVTRREKIGPPLPSLKSTFIGINLSSTGLENILRPVVVIPASKLIRSSTTLQRFLSSLWGGHTSHRIC